MLLNTVQQEGRPCGQEEQLGKEASSTPEKPGRGALVRVSDRGTSSTRSSMSSFSSSSWSSESRCQPEGALAEPAAASAPRVQVNDSSAITIASTVINHFYGPNEPSERVPNQAIRQAPSATVEETNSCNERMGGSLQSGALNSSATAQAATLLCNAVRQMCTCCAPEDSKSKLSHGRSKSTGTCAIRITALLFALLLCISLPLFLLIGDSAETEMPPDETASTPTQDSIQNSSAFETPTSKTSTPSTESVPTTWQSDPVYVPGRYGYKMQQGQVVELQFAGASAKAGFYVYIGLCMEEVPDWTIPCTTVQIGGLDEESIGYVLTSGMSASLGKQEKISRYNGPKGFCNDDSSPEDGLCTSSFMFLVSLSNETLTIAVSQNAIQALLEIKRFDSGASYLLHVAADYGSLVFLSDNITDATVLEVGSYARLRVRPTSNVASAWIGMCNGQINGTCTVVKMFPSKSYWKYIVGTSNKNTFLQYLTEKDEALSTTIPSGSDARLKIYRRSALLLEVSHKPSSTEITLTLKPEQSLLRLDSWDADVSFI